MTDEQMRIAIAEACPNLFRVAKESGDVIWKLENGCEQDCDPLNDLNAMQSAWRNHIVTAPELIKFNFHLRVIVRRDSYEWATVKLLDAVVIGATARQRAEAFLRTIGKWTE